MKVCELLHKIVIPGDVGIEIEVEGANLPMEIPMHFWNGEKDGSLRDANGGVGGGWEYILRKPIEVREVTEALTELETTFKLYDAKPVFTFRTSVHVHVNVLGMEYVNLLNFIYAYLLLEEPLINYCGKIRKGNRFCLRLQDAEGLLDTVSNLFKYHEEEALSYIAPDNNRYAAINIDAIAKYGSLEFRAMRGTMDKEVINRWCKALINIREFANNAKNPAEVFNLYQEFGPQAFLNNVLGDMAQHFHYPKMLKDMAQSFSLSIDLPFTYKKFKAMPKEFAREIKVKAPKVEGLFEDIVRPAREPGRRLIRPAIIIDDLPPEPFVEDGNIEEDEQL